MKKTLEMTSPRSHLSLLAACLMAVTLFARPSGLAAADPMKLAPESAILFVELASPETLLDPALDPATRDLFKGVDAYRKYLESPQYAQLLMVKQIVEARLGLSWEAAARDILGGGVYLAIDAANSSALVFVRGRKPEMLTRLNDTLIELIEGDAKNNGRPSPVKSEEHHGVRGWTFGGDEAHTIIDDLLIIGNKPDALKGAIDRWRDPSAKGLANASASISSTVRRSASCGSSSSGSNRGQRPRRPITCRWRSNQGRWRQSWTTIASCSLLRTCFPKVTTARKPSRRSQPCSKS